MRDLEYARRILELRDLYCKCYPATSYSTCIMSQNIKDVWGDRDYLDAWAKAIAMGGKFHASSGLMVMCNRLHAHLQECKLPESV